MIGTKKITVSLLLEGNRYEVGELVLSDGKIYFRYDADFLENGFSLSPIKLPFTSDIVSAEKEPFHGLFGVFNDSLPDKWGRLLLDRSLASKGIDISGITPLDRLSFVGSTGMGALIYQPEMEPGKDAGPIPGLDLLAKEMNQTIKRSK